MNGALQRTMSQHDQNGRKTGTRNVLLAVLLGALAFLIYVGFFVVRALHG